MRFIRIVSTTFAAAALLAQPVGGQTEIRSGHFRTTDGVSLHYLEAGTGPLLVFVPGWTMPAWIWRAQIRHFSASYRVVALDPRGNGRSEKATHGYDASRMSRDICELLEHLNDPGAVIVGWSIAGQHVLLCGEQATTNVVRAVVVVDWDLRMEPDQAFAAERIAAVQGDRAAFTRAFIVAIHRNPRPEYADSLLRAVLEVPANAAAMMTANFFFFGPHDMGPALERLGRPVQLVFSSLDWAVDAAKEARERWPSIPVEVIGETSHALFVDRPDEFNRVLEGFLTSLPD
jgi:microsomal epoxide hydrolase